MSSSDRRIAAAAKIEPEVPRGRDTLPAPPPPSSVTSVDDTDEYDALDTIPTPPPESGTTDVVIVPPHREVNLDGGDERSEDDASGEESA